MLFFEENMSKFIFLEDFYLRHFQAIQQKNTSCIFPECKFEVALWSQEAVRGQCYWHKWRYIFTSCQQWLDSKTIGGEKRSHRNKQ